MVPVFDMLNHERTCPHRADIFADDDFVHMVAGADVELGEEVRHCTTLPRLA